MCLSANPMFTKTCGFMFSGLAKAKENNENVMR